MRDVVEIKPGVRVGVSPDGLFVVIVQDDFGAWWPVASSGTYDAAADVAGRL